MCKCCCSHSLTPQILYTLLLRKRLIPPKRSHQSFLQLKKIGVSHQNRTTIIKKKSYKTEKAAILNSHAYFSFFKMEQQQQLLHFLRFKASLGLHSRLQRWSSWIHFINSLCCNKSRLELESALNDNSNFSSLMFVDNNDGS
ncbi:hypothetical protein CMV_026539 [Castanea mollissima]|uniref:Uncharacterized protein n=1 Tax=Castanea mollissima TaxID=60419 RepID=A0A8J4VF15_9ROSI|nr:hypothetical protein CMV_026539 [Castanea mollissima]